MNVTIIGAGNMGRGIGTRMVSGGHSVTVVDQNVEAAENLASELRALSHADAKISTASLENVVPGDVVVLAVWYGANMEVAKVLGEKLSGKIVVDITNPLNASMDGLATAPGTSSAEDLAKSIVEDAKVVKAFNTTFASTLVKGNVNGTPLDVFIAGDDEEAKKVLAQLVEDGGLVPVDAGPLLRSRELESLGLLNIALQIKHNLGFTTALKLVHP